MKSIAFFDFDGTITSKDTLIEFIRFTVGDFKFIKGIILLSPILILFKLNLIKNDKAKEKMFSYFFKNTDKVAFRKKATEYSLYHIPKIIRTQAMQRILWHKKNKHEVVIVSASIESWLKPWCDKNNIKLISTKVEFKNNILTGNFATKNCHGIEKVNQIKKNYALDQYSTIYAYGDSQGDKALLSIANKSYYKPFRKNHN